MTEQLIQDLIDFIKTASPLVWETLVRQVYNDAISLIFWAVVMIVVIIPAIIFGKKLHKQYIEENDHYSEKDMFSVLCYTGAGISAFLFLIFINFSIKMFFNPNFYAIRYIIDKILGQ